MLARVMWSLAAVAAGWAMIASPAPAAAEPRIALVIGNAAYAKGPLKTALGDGGLVAEALNSAGFEIVEGADLNQADLRRTFREFLAKVEAAGPDAVSFVYFSGYGLEFEGENFLIPVDARLERESDIPIDAVRLSDLLRPLASAPGAAKVVVIDASRPLPFQIQGARLARGLGAVEAPPGLLIGLASGPATVAEDGTEAYGAYATAIAEMVREPGLDLDTMFTRIRVRTHQITQGRQTPFHVASLSGPVMLVAAGTAPTSAPPAADPGAPPPPPGAAPPEPSPAPVAKRPKRPMRDYGPEEGYAFAVEQDSLPAYSEYVQAYPDSPYSKRVWLMIRARREALVWMRALELNTPEAYWTYLRRYPNGIYAFDAERRLRRLAAMTEPPPKFGMVEFADVPPPLDDEPAAFGDVYYEDGPPPPALLIGPRPAYFTDLPPPPPPRRVGLLPMAVAIPLAAAVIARPPRVYAPPPGAVPPLGTRVRPGLPGRPPQAGQPPVGALAPVPPPGARGRPGGPGGPGRFVNQPPPGAPGPGQFRRGGQPPRGGPPPAAAVAPGQPAPGPGQWRRGRGGPPPGGGAPPAAAVAPAQQAPGLDRFHRGRGGPPPAAVAPTIRRAPPPAVVNRPPPVVNRPPPVVNRPPPVVNRPPPVVNRPPPRAPAPAARAPAPAAKKCTVVGGKTICN